MEKLEIDDRYFRPSLRQKLLAVYNKHKFTLTVEPLVFLASLAFGLNEVLKQRQERPNPKPKISHSYISGDQIKFDNTEDLSKQAKLH